ncbi:MAG: hypothetical protein GXP15_12135 [Gammaproteobacteria bacterium]|nr:hypothetical protein [Gammaproteobacteria bacterium]
MLKMHMSLAVRDVTVTSEFYAALFQSKPTKSRDDYVKFEPEDLPLNISFSTLESARAADTSRHHLGIEFPSQATLDRAFERLSDANLVYGERESSVCCYANQDKFMVRDPDGYQWELYYLLSDTEIKIDPTSTCCASESTKMPCCA